MASSEEARRVELAARLRSRRADIEEAVVTRIHALADPSEIRDPEYVQGLRLSSTSAVDFGLALIEVGERRSPPLPSSLIAQARAAARNDVPIDIVLRRYVSGYMLLVEFVIEEAESKSSRHYPSLGKILREQTAVFDQLVAEVSNAYRQEAALRQSSAEHRRVKRIKGLLSGERLDISDLNYDLGAQHVAVIATGSATLAVLGELGEALDRQVLVVQPSDQTSWAWFGGRRPFGQRELGIFAAFHWPAGGSIACGEPAKGVAGWRLTHRQAAAALPLAIQTERRFIRYGDVALLASAHQDELLAASLRQFYLKPLEDQRDGGESLRQALRAYFSTGRNISSTATKLDVSRPTVERRLATVEARVGRSIDVVAGEMEIALRLEEIGAY